MSSPNAITSPPDVYYPDSDGQPMANNTVQFNWIVIIKQNLEWWYANHPDAFVAGDLFWYPIEGDNKTVQAPDVMVALGRPRGDRKSYKQWQEGGIAPHVVFEILSQANTKTEMQQKFAFYERYGVQEYYVYDPDTNDLQGWERKNNRLVAIESMKNWISPLLKIRFEHTDSELRLYHPNGERFTDYQETKQDAVKERQRAEQERQRAEQERQRAEQAKQEAVKRLTQLGLTVVQIASALQITVSEVQRILSDTPA